MDTRSPSDHLGKVPTQREQSVAVAVRGLALTLRRRCVVAQTQPAQAPFPRGRNTTEDGPCTKLCEVDLEKKYTSLLSHFSLHPPFRKEGKDLFVSKKTKVIKWKVRKYGV